MMCVVIKNFVGAGEDYVRNQLIDASVFRNAQVLITQRFMRPATQDEIQSARFEDEPEPAPAPVRKLKAMKAKRAKRA